MGKQGKIQPKIFIQMKTTAQSFFAAFIITFLLGFTACASPEGRIAEGPADSHVAYTNFDNMENDARNFSQPAALTNGGGKTITIYDKGLQMPMGTYTIPSGWELTHDIAFDPNTARATRYQVDLQGPNGELSRMFQHFYSYGQMYGTSFDHSLQQAVPAAMGNVVQQARFDRISRSPQFDQLPQFQKMKQQMAAQGMQAEGLEMPFAGMRNGRAVRGKLLFIHCQAQWGGLLMAVGQYLAPENVFGKAEGVFDEISKGYRPNPAHEQRLAQINQVAMQRQHQMNQQRMTNAQIAHQQRMSQRQAAFDAHQQNMRSMSQAQDASHQQFMGNLRNSGSYSSGNNGYSGHDAFIDQIHERSTFLDPYSGQEVHMDGQYKYNFTNGLGEFYRTNDPSFDPSSLQGNWQPINPRNY